MYIDGAKIPSLFVEQPEEKYNIEVKKPYWIEVLVDCPGVAGLFTYGFPPQLQVKPGDIVSVPFGTQIIGGIAIRLLDELPTDIPPEKVRNVEDVVSSGFFPQFYWELLNRLAEYYYTPLMQVIKLALPPGLLGRSQRRIRLARKEVDSVTPYYSETARQILDLLRSQPEGDYSFIYLQRQVRGAGRGVRELLRYGLVESYLEPPKYSKPKLQKAVTLRKNHFENDVTPRQREVLGVLRQRGGHMWQTELLQISHSSSSTLKNLASKGYISIEDREVLRNPLLEEELTADQTKLLTPAQTEALYTIRGLESFAIALLHGVTGSGKTEVYLQAIAPLLAQGKSALVLVPEIGLTPQLTDRFRARFGNKIIIYHSALSEGERFDSWRRMLTGKGQVAIGTRSSVFAPLSNLGIIILDEEHDSSFKQDYPMPTYHARTVAQWRAELENCPLLLGTATPSLESWLNVRTEKGQGEGDLFYSPTPPRLLSKPEGLPQTYYLSLPKRINSRPLPPVEIVDMRRELQQGNRSIFSRALQDALRQLQERGQQGILFIHRRGHSTFVSCRSCGYVIECPHCDVSLSYHQTEKNGPQLLRCHYCNYGQAHPQNCPECGSPYLKFFGSGTQRVMQELGKQFPDLRCIRFDSDTTRTKGSHRALLTRFANGEADLLIGTQMLTKGLDLPQVILVGVVAADGLLHLSDYRASERAFQTLTQVAGRVGRGEHSGRVIVQTYTPEHSTIEAVREHDYHTFVSEELEQRRVLNYPPYGRLILLRLSSVDPVEVQNTAQIIAGALPQEEGLDILGPAPASILRVANRYRWQIMLKFTLGSLPNLPNWSHIRQLCPSSVSLTIDVDPLNIM
ncbi:Helicase PriA essential for oriC/DnaA-independent DNA replication [Richelia intracellularis]|nr:Helicase PriA essential for oriC/DnaA-independent DNA replication [Richelia intracellularis]